MRWLLAVLLLAGVAFGQAAANAGDENQDSIAAAAKKSREAKPATAKKVYTDDDMPASKGGVSVVGGNSTAEHHAGPSDVVGDQKTLDVQWQQRIRMQREKIASLQEQLQVAEANEQRTTHYYTVNPNPKYAHYKEQADNLRQQIENAKKELSELQDEAHKAGANKAYD